MTGAGEGGGRCLRMGMGMELRMKKVWRVPFVVVVH
jgi:hypothetical protein